MSYGLACLKCRRYIGVRGFVCACQQPEPSWDLSTPTYDAQADREVRAMLAARRLSRQSTPRPVP